MSVGFVMLAHRDLDRAAEVACHLARQGAPVVIHVDRRTGDGQVRNLARAIAATQSVTLCERRVSDWGTWGLVDATLGAVRQLLSRDPDLGHVCLLSGSCIPLRPLDDLRTYLDDHPDTDFIESVAIEDVPWAMDGLEAERFTLSFPFSWKRQRKLFDAWVAIQRGLRLRRRQPVGIRPRMGSQWWCLTSRTLRAIIDDPELPRIRRFFRYVWIPDESFIQTVVRRHSTRITGRSLTLARFGYRGRPHLFYDDHLPLLLSSDAFFARKVWPGAREVYGHFLGPAAGRITADPAQRVDHVLTRSVDRRRTGRAGLVNPGRFPAGWADTRPTATPFTVLHGFDHVYPGFRDWLAPRSGGPVHGRLFAPARAHFAGDVSQTLGGLTDHPILRDYDPAGFLRNLVWNDRGQSQTFFTGSEDNAHLPGILVRDPGARILVVTGAWLLALDDTDTERFLRTAARIQRAEIAALETYGQWWARSRTQVWTLADALADPAAPVAACLGAPAWPAPADIPPHADPAPLRRRLDLMRDAGITAVMAGDLDAVLGRGSRLLQRGSAI